MTRLFNDPATFAEDMLAGFLDANAQLRRRRPRRRGPRHAKPAGQGRGRGRRRIRPLPRVLRCGGHGFADGAVVGNIFTSPSAQEAASVARAAHGDAGVLLITGNYAGDVMNFGLAVNNCAPRASTRGTCGHRRHRQRPARGVGEAARHRRRLHRIPLRQCGCRGGRRPRHVERVAAKANDGDPHPRGGVRRLHHARRRPAAVHGRRRHHGSGPGHPRRARACRATDADRR